MQKVNLVLVGFGNVGRAFFELVREKKENLRSRYALDLHLVAIFRRAGGIFDPDEIRVSIDDLRWQKAVRIEDVLSSVEPGVLVECAASSSSSGQPGLDFMTQAFQAKWHVVTADKGPLVMNLHELKKKAVNNRVSFKISGATAAALPALDVALVSLAGTEIQEIEGILNGTSNHILTRMQEGWEYQAALKESQEKGIVEPDPSFDVGGWDTACKLLLITNTVFGTCFTPGDVDVKGITDISDTNLKEGVKQGKKWKLLGTARKEKDQLWMDVKPTLLDASHPLFHVDRANKGISLVTDTMGRVTVSGGKSDPRGAAAAMLKDLINIHHSI